MKIMDVQYNNLYTHFVFTTKDRFPCISEIHRERIEKYITGIVNNHECKMYAIYANPEHVHFLVSRDPAMSEKELADLIAKASEIFINSNKLCKGKFYWQPSCSAFSVSKNDIDKVCKYILNQPEHHKKQTFIEEYTDFLRFYQHTLSGK
jgi:REP element-mobilizing transposase RayT